MDPLWLVLPGLCIWGIILLLPWRPWSTRETLDANPNLKIDLSTVTALIPARNEARYIVATLQSLAEQGNNLRILLIDDESTDATTALAESLNLPGLQILKGTPLVRGWSGKLWALEQGRQAAETKYLLLLDADITLKPGLLPELLAKLEREDLRLISLMAFLRMETLWEKMLMPAFIYFFKLLYPFRLSNSGSKLVAAAAGGCILIERQTLNDIGGFEALKGELIDDCALARRVKNIGRTTWTGLTHSALSQRHYDNLHSIWVMVARTAFTQLRYSIPLLFVCTFLMLAAFVAPLMGFFTGVVACILFSCIIILIMSITYYPTLKYYGVNILWVATLPATGLLYLLMTWSSAINHWRGVGSSWKGRTYTEGA